jgi:formylmethanofuran:tetrahydromethanopterin formyltransferase
MEIACIRSTVWTTIPLVRMREALVWKLLAAEVQPSGRQGTTVQMRLKRGKNFTEIFGKPIAKLAVRTPYDYHPDDT